MTLSEVIKKLEDSGFQVLSTEYKNGNAVFEAKIRCSVEDVSDFDSKPKSDHSGWDKYS